MAPLNTPGVAYTDDETIAKVINPLFVDSLKQQLNEARFNQAKIQALALRLQGIRVIDPSCGNGNFLVASYNALLGIEEAIKGRLKAFKGVIKPSQCIGIEIDPVACDQAKGRLPGCLIINDNALSLDWLKLTDFKREVYIVGNPPFLSPRDVTKSQQSELVTITGSAKLDYSSCWVVTSAKVMARRHNVTTGLIITSSLTQGIQACLMSSLLKAHRCDPWFAYQPFKWSHHPDNKAAVHCVIVGLRSKQASNKQGKVIVDGNGLKRPVKAINGHLMNAPHIHLKPHNKPLAWLPPMRSGSTPGGLMMIMTGDEYDQLIASHPQAKPLLRPYLSGDDLLYSKRRYCLMVSDDQLKLALSVPEVKARLNAVDLARAHLNGRYPSKPNHWLKQANDDHQRVVLPRVSGERREWLPVTVISKGIVISEQVYSVDLKHDASNLWLVSLLSSRLHMAWLKAFCGRLGHSLRYPPTLVYNALPWLLPSQHQKHNLNQAALSIIKAQGADDTLSSLYNPETMTPNLRGVLMLNDRLVDGLFKADGFDGDDARLAYLMRTYNGS